MHARTPHLTEDSVGLSEESGTWTFLGNDAAHARGGHSSLQRTQTALVLLHLALPRPSCPCSSALCPCPYLQNQEEARADVRLADRAPVTQRAHLDWQRLQPFPAERPTTPSSPTARAARIAPTTSPLALRCLPIPRVSSCASIVITRNSRQARPYVFSVRPPIETGAAANVSPSAPPTADVNSQTLAVDPTIAHPTATQRSSED